MARRATVLQQANVVEGQAGARRYGLDGLVVLFGALLWREPEAQRSEGSVATDDGYLGCRIRIYGCPPFGYEIVASKRHRSSNQWHGSGEVQQCGLADARSAQLTCPRKADERNQQVVRSLEALDAGGINCAGFLQRCTPGSFDDEQAAGLAERESDEQVEDECRGAIEDPLFQDDENR